MGSMTGGDYHDSLKTHAGDKLKSIGRHLPRIHITRVRRHQGHDLPGNRFPGSTGKEFADLPGENFSLRRVEGSGHCGPSHLFFHGACLLFGSGPILAVHEN